MTPLGLLKGLVLLIYFLSLFLLFLYGINCYIMILLHRRARERMLKHDEEVWKAWKANDHQLPTVTVQLPIYNERYVIQRLIEAVVRLNYPKDRLEIQILDDSTDETTAIATTLTLVLAHKGAEIQGIWKLQGGGRGSLEGKVDGDRATFVLRPLSEECPGSGGGSARIEGAKLSGEYRGQDCRGKIKDGKFEVRR